MGLEKRCTHRIPILLLFLALLPAVLPGGGWTAVAMAEEKTVQTEGSSTLSREDAIRQALRAAVESGVGVFLQSQTEIENFALQKDKVFSRSEGYVTRYKLLKETKAGDLITVTVSATVSLDRIKDDLVAMKILLESMEHPKLMVLVEDGGPGPGAGMEIAAAALSEQLLAKGFELVDAEQMKRVRTSAEVRQALAGDAAAAKSLGQQFDAQYVIVGKAATQEAGEAYPGSGMRSVQASLQLRVIQTQTGLVLGSVVKSGAGAHVSPQAAATAALQKTALKACDEYLVNAITGSFQNFLNNGSPVKLQIAGIGSFSDYKRVTGEIETIERVVSSKKEGWSKSGGLVLVDLRFRGTSQELAEMLDGLRMGERQLEVVDVAPERIDCRIR
jgi:hypothetical protein